MAQKIPAKEVLHELFYYVESTGLLHWRKARHRTKVKAGDVAGCEILIGSGKHRRARRVIHITGRNYLAVRLIAKMFLDIDDEQVITTKDDDLLNTKLDNLVVTDLTSIRRRQRLQIPTSDTVGITWHHGKYRVCIGFNGKDVNVGRFADMESAKAAREAAEIKYGYPERRKQRLA